MYPEARMVLPMKIWKLPDGKENMFAEVCENGKYFASEKIDGFWYQYEKTQNYAYLFSRSVSKVTGLLSEKSENVPHIMEALAVLPPNTTLIGEIYYPGKTSKDVTTIMGCLPEEARKRQKGNPIHYYVHDIIMYDGVNLINAPAEDRYKILNKIWYLHHLNTYPFLLLAETFTENIAERTAEILARGGEGVVLKKKNSKYTPDKRPAWDTIKIKQMDSVDLVCIGLCAPTKEYTGKDLENWTYWENMNGNLYCGAVHSNETMIPVTKPYYYGWKTAMEIGGYNSKGELVKIGTVSSGLTDVDRERMSTNPEEYIGHVFEFSCMSIDKKERTLRHPRLVRKREDKNAKDCILEEIFV